jgi:hypothetical protein
MSLTVSVNVQEVQDKMIRQRDTVDIRIARSKAVKTGHQNRTACDMTTVIGHLPQDIYDKTTRDSHGYAARTEYSNRTGQSAFE